MSCRVVLVIFPVHLDLVFFAIAVCLIFRILAILMSNILSNYFLPFICCLLMGSEK